MIRLAAHDLQPAKELLGQNHRASWCGSVRRDSASSSRAELFTSSAKPSEPPTTKVTGPASDHVRSRAAKASLSYVRPAASSADYDAGRRQPRQEPAALVAQHLGRGAAVQGTSRTSRTDRRQSPEIKRS